LNKIDIISGIAEYKLNETDKGVALKISLSPIFASLLCSKKFWAHKINFFEASHLVFNDRFVPSCRIGGT